MLNVRLGVVPVWLRFVLAACIVAGAAFRFAFLDAKVYSKDESLTSLRVSGHLLRDYERGVENRVVSVGELRSYQRTGAGASATVRALAVDDPQHPPLYYLALRPWDRLVNDSIAGRRALGAIFAVLGIAAIAWLCLEFIPGGWGFALLCAGLFAVSPFQQQYAQQAREYSLWTLLTIAASALLVRALRTGERATWIAYAAALVLGLYTHLYFVFVLVGHAIVVTAGRRTRSVRELRPPLVAMAVAVCSFVPWIAIIYANRATLAATNTWFGVALPGAVYAYKWLFSFGTVFFDAEYVNLLYSIVLVPLAVLIAYALYVLARTRATRLRTFVAAVMAVAVAPLLIPDLLLHQSRATAPRYVAPAWIAVDLAVGFLLARGLGGPAVARRSAALATAALLSLGIVSAAAGARAGAWWPSSNEGPLLPIAAQLARETPAFVTTGDPEVALELSNYLPDRDRFDVTAAPATRTIRQARANVFLIDPSPATRAQLTRAGLRLHVAYAQPFTGSPMLQHLGPLNAIKNRLAAIRANANIHDDTFTLWAVGQTVVSRR